MKNEVLKTDKAQVIGADLGRGYVKGFSIHEGKALRCCFKSVVGIGRNIDFSEYKNPMYLEVDGIDYFVGLLAEKEGDSPTPNSKESKVTLTAERLLFALLNEVCMTDKVKIIFTVPYKSYNKTTLQEVQDKYKGRKVTIKDLIKGTFKTITIEDVAIYREADSALYWELREMETTKKPIGMITVGFRTTELTYYDKGMLFNDKKSKSVELGNKTSLEYAQRMLLSQGTSKELFEIDTNEDDYNELKERGYTEVYERVTQEIDNTWINLDEMDIYIGGGTVMKMNVKDYTVIEDPQMATAKGAYLVGTKYFK